MSWCRSSRPTSGKLGLPNLMAKKNFYELAEHVPRSEIDPEIVEKLDAVARVAVSAASGGRAGVTSNRTPQRRPQSSRRRQGSPSPPGGVRPAR